MKCRDQESLDLEGSGNMLFLEVSKHKGHLGRKSMSEGGSS